MVAYVQPLGDAIGIMCTLLLTNTFAVVMLFDVRGWATRYANSTVKAYERPAYKFLVFPRTLKSMRDPVYQLRLLRQISWLTLAVFGPILIVELVILTTKGVR